MTDEVIELTQYQTSQFALEKSGKELKTTAKEIELFIGLSTKNPEKIIPKEKHSIDDVIVAFKGRSGLKQYIRSKPNRWGYKLWARTGGSGILHDFDVYQGSKEP
ncbi:hypothetical protein RRG08_064168 [Elysia crispata]|uniref:PiggyBac transposable element-derived protein domain-containing protein n=1 Tax=Elysia crispata TaxID=231223 RepID=A0AAE1AE85_9GAST|nr:hypothetical protein RRG08_064168 [Elysia crispata]